MTKSWVIISLSNFLISGIIGFILRISQLYDFNFPYSHFLHAHSHVAILGWLYLIFFSLIYSHFIPEKKENFLVYNRLFWITQISVTGMLISFPIQGYGAFSIAFSTLHIFCSYYFCWITWKRISAYSTYDILFLKTALLFMLLSTLGVWALGFIIPTAGKNSPLYSIAIQFFLHFQINGWFLFSLFSILLKRITSFSAKKVLWFYRLSVLSVILTIALPVSWYFPLWDLHLINDLGILIQLIVLFLFLKYIHPQLRETFKNKTLTNYLFWIFTFLYSLKILFQLFLLFPEFAENSHSIRNFTIGFIHLIVLGIYSTLLFGFIAEKNSKNILIRSGIGLFVSIFIISESLLFLQGIFIYWGLGKIPAYFSLISWISAGYPIGIFLLLAGTLQFYKK